MKTIHLNITSPERTLFDGAVEAVTLPGAMGRFTILPQHAPIVSSLRAGQLAYLVGGRTEFIDVQSGFMEMSGGRVSVCIEQKM